MQRKQLQQFSFCGARLSQPQQPELSDPPDWSCEIWLRSAAAETAALRQNENC